MAQPPAYAPVTDFSADELDNSGGRSTVGTAELDAELAAIALSISGIRTNLSLNQRDDGEIRDARVKLHTLSTQVLALLSASGGTTAGVPRGAWVTATAYVLRDVVTINTNTYICCTAHTSGVFATDLAAVKWLLLTLGSSPTSAGIAFTPTATIAAVTVQTAIDEADTENRALSLANTTSIANILDATSAVKGAALVGFNSALAYAGSTVGAFLVALGSSASGSVGAGQIAYSAANTYTSGSVGRYIGDRIRETGTRCLAIGLLAGSALVAGSTDVVAIGPSAGAAITTGFGHVLIGTNAGKTLTAPAYCTAVGAYALEFADQIGNVNLMCTAIGAYALNKNIATGQYNTAVGAYAGQNTTTGYFNTFIGMNCGVANTIGFSNTFVGHGAGLALAGVSNWNTFVGEAAGQLTTLTLGTCLFGYSAGTNNLTGNYLHAFGYAAAAQSTGGLGTAFGKQAAYSVLANTGWLAIGYEAGINVLGTNWTALGHQAMGGASANYSGSQTAIGYRAAYANAAAYDNTTALGANSTNTRSNQIMLGDSATIVEVRTAGYLVQKLVATGSTTLDNNREFAFYVLDDTHVNFKMKGSDGVVRFATGAFGGGGFVLA